MRHCGTFRTIGILPETLKEWADNSRYFPFRNGTHFILNAPVPTHAYMCVSAGNPCLLFLCYLERLCFLSDNCNSFRMAFSSSGVMSTNSRPTPTPGRQ